MKNRNKEDSSGVEVTEEINRPGDVNITEIERYQQLAFATDITRYNEKQLNITIEELVEQGHINLRCYNVLLNNGLLTTRDILIFQQNSPEPDVTFLYFRNSGVKTNKIILAYCALFDGFQNKDVQGEIEKQIKSEVEEFQKTKESIAQLSEFQNELLQCYILININNKRSSVKSYFHMLSNDFSIQNYYEVLSFHPIKSIIQKNIHKTTASTIKQVHAGIIAFYHKIISITDHSKLIEEWLMLKLAPKYKLSENEVNTLRPFIEKHGAIPLFQLLNILIENNALFGDGTKTNVFKAGFNYYSTCDHYSLEEIGKKNHATKIKLILLRKQIHTELFESFEFIGSLTPYMYPYEIDKHADLIEIEDKFVACLGERESVSFNAQFIKTIFSFIYHDSHCLIGNELDVIYSSPRHHFFSHNWRSTYLVKRVLFDTLDFERLVNELTQTERIKLNITRTIPMKEYLYAFRKDKGPLAEGTISTAAYIIWKETAISIDTNQQIVLERKTRKYLTDYIFEALEQEGKPMPLLKLYNVLIEKHPDITKCANALRTSILLLGDSLICFGRTSTYGLKKWEKTGNHIQGGTIRKMVEAYLNKFDDPKSMADIAKHILIYRPDTNRESIFNNLRLSKTGRFVLFEGSFFGLNTKSYSEKYKLLKVSNDYEQSFEEKWKRLLSFIHINKRLPSSVGRDEEISLYRFFYKQKNKLSQNKLTAKQTKQVNDLIQLIDMENLNFTKRWH